MIDMEDDPQGSGLFGPATAFGCTEAEGDEIEVRRLGRALTTRGRVALRIAEDDDYATVMLTPEAARRFAAAVLDIADELDGTTPLVFSPPGT